MLLLVVRAMARATAPRVLRLLRLLRVLEVIRQRRAYSNAAYTLTIFPLGLLYIALIAAGTTAGFMLLPMLVGLLILAATVSAWWGMGRLERTIGVHWLGADARPLARPRVAPGRAWLRWWRLGTAYLGSHQTWMTLGYLLLKVPLGLLGLGVVGGLAVLATGFLVAPLPFLVEEWGDGAFSPAAEVAVVASMLATGTVSWAASLHAANGFAWISAALIRLMLGQGDTALRLEAATATAAWAQARADRAERSRQELIVNVGHELRTPTATIRGHVESLLLGLEGEAGAAPSAPPVAETLRHHLGIVQRETHRLGTLIDELLTLARADSGELTLQLAPVSAGDVVEEVYQSVAPLARRERQVTLTRGVEPAVPAALADRQRLVQVLLNLVRNAVAYTPEGGIVAVTADWDPAGHVVFSVVDTGVGIAPEDLPHVFERFYRADPSRTRTSGGYGLGLSIVKDLVRAMGGTVAVESVVGEGTRFRVALQATA